MQTELQDGQSQPLGQRPPAVAFAHGFEPDIQGVVSNGGLVQLQDVAVVADLHHVLQRLQIHRPVAGHATGSTVVGGQPVVLAAKPLDLLRKILDAAFDVGVDTQFPKRRGHHLKIPAGAVNRDHRAIAAGLVQYHGARQIQVQLILIAESLDLRVDLHDLAVHPEQGGRERIERQELIAAGRGRLARGPWRGQAG